MPEAFTEHLKSMLVGFEIPIDRLEPCFKLNQHKDAADTTALLQVFRSSGDSLLSSLADMMQAHCELADRETIAAYLKKYKID